MRAFFGINQVEGLGQSAVALGVFDGMHCGHRQILRYLVRQAKELRQESIVVTFWPNPKKKDSLFSLQHRLRLFSELGVGNALVIKFNKTFSEITPEDFVKKILIDKLSVNFICVGKNFRFGRNAKGDVGMLRRLSKKYKFGLKVFKIVKAGGYPVSSTIVRKLISEGNLRDAQRLLRSPVSILGTVIKGVALGRKLGFPTANVNPHHEVLPPNAVYAVNIYYNNKPLKGICYIGSRPTFKRDRGRKKTKSKKQVEVYLFNFRKNIYGEYLYIKFKSKIRDEKKFPSASFLCAQIRNDIRTAKKALS